MDVESRYHSTNKHLLLLSTLIVLYPPATYFLSTLVIQKYFLYLNYYYKHSVNCRFWYTHLFIAMFTVHIPK